jgi:hypothetical protein
MQQIRKRAGGGQPFLEQGQGVFLLTEAENDGFIVGATIHIQIQSKWRTPRIYMCSIRNGSGGLQ